MLGSREREPRPQDPLKPKYAFPTLKKKHDLYPLHPQFKQLLC